MGSTNGSRDLATPLRPLDVAVGLALVADVPTRVFFDDGLILAELYVHRGRVLHANVDGIHGLAAIAALLAADHGFHVEYDIRPPRCSLTGHWATLRRAATRPTAFDDGGSQLGTRHGPAVYPV